MQLLSSWRESLSLFKPANFKLFMLVTLNSLLITYKVWLKYWGWLIVALAILEVKMGIMAHITVMLVNGVAMIPLKSCTAGLPVGMWIWVLYILSAVLLFGLILSVRPSLALKNYSYFAGYARHIIYVFVWFALLTIGSYGYCGFLENGSYWLTNTLGVVVGLVRYPLLSCISIWFMLFLCDTHGSAIDAIKSLWRAVKMAAYNLPFWVLIYLLFLLLAVGLFELGIVALAQLGGVSSQYILYVLNVLNFLDVFIYLPLFINLITNFYIKRVHEQYQLYFR